jgi:hypothetical protein
MNKPIYWIAAIYTIYMLNWFKTITNVAHPLSYFENPLLYHPVHKLTEAINPVCPLGNMLSWPLAAYLAVQGFGVHIPSWTNNIILVSTIVLSLLNFNVLLYLLPVIILLYISP